MAKDKTSLKPLSMQFLAVSRVGSNTKLVLGCMVVFSDQPRRRFKRDQDDDQDDDDVDKYLLFVL